MSEVAAAGAPPVTVPIRAGDRELRLRRAVPDDVDGLLALYERMGAADRHRRFFSGVLPPRSTVERWVAPPENLVVVVESEGVIVAEAGVAHAGSGRGELGIAVDAAHRGWLGPFLLDLVLRLAGEAGAPAVEAEVLATNRPMLAMLAARGTARMPSGDPSVVRLLLGTSTTIPAWPDPLGPHRTRVLLELGVGGSAAAEALAAAGCDVVACRGPAGAGRAARRWRCPLLAGEPCPLVEGADLVATAEGPADGSDEARVLAALPSVHPRTRRVRTPPHPAPDDVVAAVLEAVRTSAADRSAIDLSDASPTSG